MEIQRVSALSQTQRRQVKELEAQCQSAGSSLTFPLEEEAIFYLLYSQQEEIGAGIGAASDAGVALTPSAPSRMRLLCALALLLPEEAIGEEAAQCVAFTHPDFRQRGCFSLLLQRALEEVEDTDLLFLTDGRSQGALAALASLGAERDSDEYRMELDLTKPLAPLSPCRAEEQGESPLPPASSQKPPRRLFLQKEEEEDKEAASVLTYSFYLTDGHILAARCYVAVYGRRGCFFGFLVEEAFRKKGLGTEALLLVLEDLKGEGFSSLFLHVSGDNLPAVRLYEKTGFRITETLSYYLY